MRYCVYQRGASSIKVALANSNLARRFTTPFLREEQRKWSMSNAQFKTDKMPK
jgi:hypothetical protein